MDREAADMLLTITTTHQPASDLGFLLHKHPDRCQSFDLSFGKVHVYYPEVGGEQCSACLLLDVDPWAWFAESTPIRASCWRSTSMIGPTPHRRS